MGIWYNQIFQYKKTDTQAFIIGDDDKVVISFRGTESKQDVITDLKAEWKKFSFNKDDWGNVHCGFFEALEDVWDLLIKFVKQNDPEFQKEYWITGHSLGAALAVLFSAKWIHEGFPANKIQSIYTFGAPKVGDSTFANTFNSHLMKKTFRMVNHNDLIPRVLLFEYYHVGQLKYFDCDGNLSSIQNWWHWVLDFFKGFIHSWSKYLGIKSFFIPDGLLDHKVANYINTIGKLLPSTAQPTKLEWNEGKIISSYDISDQKWPHENLLSSIIIVFIKYWSNCIELSNIYFMM